MAEPFIAEVRIFAGNFAPRGWTFCDGQLMPIAQYTAVFSLVGTTYGGDGRTTFGVPDLRGRLPMHPGRGPGLTPRVLGEKAGSSTITLVEAQIPSHAHGMRADDNRGTSDDPTNHILAQENDGARDRVYVDDSSTDHLMLSSNAIGTTGGGQAHENRQPFLGLSFIFALVGLYPSRN